MLRSEGLDAFRFFFKDEMGASVLQGIVACCFFPPQMHRQLV